MTHEIPQNIRTPVLMRRFDIDDETFQHRQDQVRNLLVFLSPKQQAVMPQIYQDGKLAKSYISGQLNVSRENLGGLEKRALRTLDQIEAKFGMDAPETLYELYIVQGHSAVEISHTHGLSVNQVYYLLDKIGVGRRPLGRPHKLL